jgi:hypothetical protein
MMKEYVEGIYFNMPEQEYHSIKYFSRSFAEEMLVDEGDAWAVAPDNPEPKLREATPAMKLGTAIHAMILEPVKFATTYRRALSYDSFPEKIILNKNDELAGFLASVGEKKTGKKEDLVARALPYVNPETHVIWDCAEREFQERVESEKLVILSDAESETAAGMLDSYEHCEKVQEIFQGGQAEITLIWQDESTGVMCKCRLDYARPESIGEVKTFAMKRKKNMYQAMCAEIVYEHYNMQFYVYHEALRILINKVRENKAKVFGEVDASWLEEFLAVSDKQLFMVFMRTQSPYQVKAIEMQRRQFDGATENSYYTEGQRLFRFALNKYKFCKDTQKEKPWRNRREVEVLVDEHVPAIMYQTNNYL